MHGVFLMIANIVSSFPAFGFSGSRSCPAATTAAQGLFPFVPSGAAVFVGCAGGVDRAVRAAFPDSQVFEVEQFKGAVSLRAALAMRSAAMVQQVAAVFGLLVVFPSTPCPAAVRPSRSFAGHGSGSWGSAAYAIGLSVPVLICLPPEVEPPPWLASIGSPVQGSPFWFVQSPQVLF